MKVNHRKLYGIRYRAVDDEDSMKSEKKLKNWVKMRKMTKTIRKIRFQF